MVALKQYTIPIEGLKDGMHQFDFQINKAFFKHFEESPVKDGNLKLKLLFEKRQDLSVFTFDFEGIIHTACDRCMESINLPLKGSEQLIVKYADQAREEAEVIYITHTATEINVAKFAYEFICLAIPMIKVYDCESKDPKPCNETVLDNLYKEEDIEKNSNPVWEALKNFKKK